jgi:hypothetical protein
MRRLAVAMRKPGLAPQHRVGVIALNSDRYLELYLALFGVPDPRWGESVYAVVFGRTQVTPDQPAAPFR